MGVVPDTRLGKIEFYESHMAAWTANAAAIGLTPIAVTNLGLLVTAARAAYTAHIVAQEAARAATANFYDRVRTMHSGPAAGADMIQTIKNYAQTKNDPNVYVLAQVPPPAIPSVTPPPGTPFEFSVNLLQDGSLSLKWKCNNPSGTVGTIYEVQRKTGSGPFAFIGASGTKSFTDSSVPAGSSPVSYQLTAVRSTARGNPAQFVVNFGVAGPGVSTVEVTPVKLAA